MRAGMSDTSVPPRPIVGEPERCHHGGTRPIRCHYRLWKTEDKQVYGLAGSYDFGTFRLLGGLQYVTGADNLAGLWLGKLADGSADYGRLSGAAVGLGAVIPLGKNKVEVMTGYASGRYGKEFAQAGETYDLTGFAPRSAITMSSASGPRFIPASGTSSTKRTLTRRRAGRPGLRRLLPE